MRNIVLFIAMTFSAVAIAQAVHMGNNTPIELNNCASGGSSAQALPAGVYWVRSMDEEVWLCKANSASTCASGGDRFPIGERVMTFDKDYSVSCRSSSGTGDLILTRLRKL